MAKKYILWFDEVSKKDIPLVGGKNASLGEMFNQLNKKGINVPYGFAFTTQAYWYFLKKNQMEKKLKKIFEKFEPKSLKSLKETGQKARNLILGGEFPEDLRKEIVLAYQKLSSFYKEKNLRVAVRSSGVAEDAPTMSFAGQFETFLNISGEKELLRAIKRCLASAFNDRVVAYREEKKVPHLKFALSVGVQKMIRSDLVGEMIVKGKITPDEFYVFKATLKQGYKSIIVKNLGRKTKKYIFAKKGGLREAAVSKKDQSKFSLTDEEVLTLAKWACQIEEHYKIPQDIEWAKDGKSGQLFIVQSRPETIYSSKEKNFYEEYTLKAKKKPILTGISVGTKIGQGKARVITDASKISQFQKGEVLVTKMTDPDWVPIMRIASAIVTDEGGRVSHAAIISRELGIPAVVGTMKATKLLKAQEKKEVSF